MSDDVRQAAKALFDLGAANGGDPGTFDRDSAEIRAYLDRVFAKAWESSPLRAALASGERGVAVDRCDACGSPRRDLRGEVDPTVARKWFRLDIKDGPRHFRYECRDPWHAAPAENDAGRGE